MSMNPLNAKGSKFLVGNGVGDSILPIATIGLDLDMFSTRTRTLTTLELIRQTHCFTERSLTPVRPMTALEFLSYYGGAL